MGVSSTEIIEAIKTLPPEQKAEVARFVQQIECSRPLSPNELGGLGELLAKTTNQVDAEKLQASIINGFYGAKVDA